jgi:hypothetical protein
MKKRGFNTFFQRKLIAEYHNSGSGERKMALCTALIVSGLSFIKFAVLALAFCHSEVVMRLSATEPEDIKKAWNCSEVDMSGMVR